MSKRFILVLATVLSACEPTSPPLQAFHILDVAPLTQKTNESKHVRVQLDTDPAFLVDYGEPAARMVGQPRMVIGPRTIPLTYLGHGLFEGYVEPLAPSNYIVGVNLGDGREATFATPYVVTAVEEPELPVARATYDFARIDPQVQGRPFTVTITVNVHGQVEGAPPYQGAATLTVHTGGEEIFRASVEPVTAGKIPIEVIINRSGDDFVAKIEDATGEQAFSNAFPVAPSES
ncbi:hypothetical protein D187_007987 [Cystobacter fuscus DSM 2262]|uniref:Lipoprotein n=1 Tax=Cystobacter fuscus (strain ATCC 25194 / DSM 2262 / NBRC 100088 / M29) TaxID=1242864 RepID=S9NWT9_CYSF2|nr:hypothetical protein [Cystobacter fuscus]EPX56645.1 hypothetical protein D187_007987 [Cystobacter fuscus DSM 2262]